jgi:hypothetical protein
MKVVKHKDLKIRKPDAREQMRLALMDLVRDAQSGNSMEIDNSPLMRSARFIGSAAGWIHRIFTWMWFKTILAVAALYLLMRWTGISVSVFHNMNLLFRIN